jgi:hypothetical protein
MAGLTPLFSVRDINKMLKKFEDRAEEKILTILQRAGEMFVREARLHGAYNDITGNLRSSIGYAVVKNGRIIAGQVQQAKKGSDKKTGVERARRLLDDLAATHDKGWVLIGVAGMDYAVYVENISGKDVISSSAKEAEQLLKETIKKVIDG